MSATKERARGLWWKHANYARPRPLGGACRCHPQQDPKTPLKSITASPELPKRTTGEVVSGNLGI